MAPNEDDERTDRTDREERDADANREGSADDSTGDDGSDDDAEVSANPSSSTTDAAPASHQGEASPDDPGARTGVADSTRSADESVPAGGDASSTAETDRSAGDAAGTDESVGGDTRSDPNTDRTENTATPDATMGDETDPKTPGDPDAADSSADADAEGASSVDPTPDDGPGLTEDDVGKGVFDGDGNELGLVVTVEEGGSFRVETDPGLTDRIRGALGWERDEEDDREIARSAVERVEGDRVVVDTDAVGVESRRDADDRAT